MAGKLWTKEEIDRLKVLKSEGKSYAQIAEELNRSYNSVATKYRESLAEKEEIISPPARIVEVIKEVPAKAIPINLEEFEDAGGTPDEFIIPAIIRYLTDIETGEITEQDTFINSILRLNASRCKCTIPAIIRYIKAEITRQ